MSTPPLYLLDPLPVDGVAELAGAEGRHAATVRRIRVGEVVWLADGRGNRAVAEVTSIAPDKLALRITERGYLAPPSLRVVLAQALVKGERGELAVELATEAGVDGVLPWRAQRCVARWDDGPRGQRALQRWRSAARAAAKQSRRPWLPEVAAAVDTAALAKRVAGAAGALVLHEAAIEPLAGAKLPDGGELLVIVGPEGGIAADELDQLTAAGAQPVRLGPEVLRASTAAAVALGALGVLTDRWRSQRG